MSDKTSGRSMDEARDELPTLSRMSPSKLSNKAKSSLPMGTKATPMTKKAGRTVPAVRIGCQAGRAL